MEPHLRPRGIAACAEFPNDNPALHRGAIWRCVEVGGKAVCERSVAPSPEQDIVAPLEPTPTEPVALALEAVADDLVEDVAVLMAEVAALVEKAAPVESIEPIEPAAAVEAAPATSGVAADGQPVASASPNEDFPEPSDALAAPDEDARAAPDEDAVEPLDEDAEGDEAIVVVDDLAFDDIVVEEVPAEAPAARDEAPSADPFAVLLRVLEEVARGAGCPEDALVGLRVVLGAARVDESIMPRACVDALLSAGMLQQGDHGLARAEPFARQVVAWQGILRGESEDFGACGSAMLDEWCAGLLAKIMGNPARVEGLRRDLRGRGVAAFGLVADAA
jgi:hypothetical protein